MSRIMGKRVVCLTTVLVAIGCAVAGQHAAASTIAIQDWSGAIEYTTQFKGVTSGYEFTVGATPITVTKLGFFDHGANGLGESHAVGIWQVGNTTALATATLTTSSLLEGPMIAGAGQFRFEELSSVLQLGANTSYRIGAYYSSTHNDAWAQTATSGSVSWSVASEISYSSGSAKYYYDTALSYPSDPSTRRFAYIGPNFQFVPVPEPGTLGLLLSGGGGLVMFVRRRRSPRAAPSFASRCPIHVDRHAVAHLWLFRF